MSSFSAHIEDEIKRDRLDATDHCQILAVLVDLVGQRYPGWSRSRVDAECIAQLYQLKCVQGALAPKAELRHVLTVLRDAMHNGSCRAAAVRAQ